MLKISGKIKDSQKQNDLKTEKVLKTTDMLKVYLRKKGAREMFQVLKCFKVSGKIRLSQDKLATKQRLLRTGDMLNTLKLLQMPYRNMVRTR